MLPHKSIVPAAVVFGVYKLYIYFVCTYVETMGNTVPIETQVQRDVKLLNRQERKLDREIVKMERKNVGNIHAIKKYATDGNMEMVKALSREYMTYKKNTIKLTRLRGQMSNIKQRIQMNMTSHEINKAIVSLTNTMKTMNKSMGMENIQNMIMEFDMESARADAITEVLDDALNQDADEDEEDELVSSVLDEIGVQMSTALASAPTGSLTNDRVERELEMRFQQLSN
jgi:charged multivesicular body protein 2A